MTSKEYWAMTKWELLFIDGFFNIMYILDCHETVEHFPDDFWEALSIGWLNMEGEYNMSKPGFDPYNLSGRDSYYSYVMSQK